MTLDEAVQLHEYIEINYRVDCFAAQLLTHDGRHKFAEGIGDTIQAAMKHLEGQIEKVDSLDEIRKAGG